MDKTKEGRINMLKTSVTLETLHTHTQAYLENKITRAYKVCFNINVYRTDQLII